MKFMYIKSMRNPKKEGIRTESANPVQSINDTGSHTCVNIISIAGGLQISASKTINYNKQH